MSVNQIRKVAVVGGGLTGGLIARMLSEIDGVQVTVFEKEDQVGGRMITRSFFGGETRCDSGAQFVTKTAEWSEDVLRVHEMLVKEELLEELGDDDVVVGEDPYGGDGAKHFVSRPGIGSVVERLFAESSASIRLASTVTNVQVENGSLDVKLNTGMVETFDNVVITIPRPLGLIEEVGEGMRKSVEGIVYSQRYGLVTEISGDANCDWMAKYVSGDESKVIRYVCCDSRKKKIDGTSVVMMAHSSVPFAMKNCDEITEEEIRSILHDDLVENVLQIEPEMVIRSELFHWGVSQLYRNDSVQKLMQEQGRKASLIVNESPMLILAGDGFVGSGFGNCVESALEVVRTMDGEGRSEWEGMVNE